MLGACAKEGCHEESATRCHVGPVRRATIRVISLSIALAAADLLIPVANAQRETAPAGVTNYTRVDATVACAGATPVQALSELKKNGFVCVESRG